MSGALVVDFDGVVCDALEECALVTWLGVHGVDQDIPVSAYRRAPPAGFLDHFAVVRSFSRTLDHFAVTHLKGAPAPTSRREFDDRFGSLPGDFVATFVRKANAARARCREEEPRFWLGLHTLYPGIADLLRRHAGRVHVITAKDVRSVRSILRAHGLEDTVDEVYGGVSAKDAAMLDLCAAKGLDIASTDFIDDNLTNVERVAAVGARSHWATWGYHTPEDRDRADALAAPRLALAQLDAFSIEDRNGTRQRTGA